jgi:hypothetical protein
MSISASARAIWNFGVAAAVALAACAFVTMHPTAAVSVDAAAAHRAVQIALSLAGPAGAAFAPAYETQAGDPSVPAAAAALARWPALADAGSPSF